MNTHSRHANEPPAGQRAIQDKCFHPTGKFVEFETEDIEQSLSGRFEKQVRKYPGRAHPREPG